MNCITNPAKDSILVLRKWYVDICDGNRCAAAVLSYLIYCHELQFAAETTEQHEESNDDEILYQRHSYDDFIKHTLFLYGKASVIRALKLLEEKGIISKETNKPNLYLLHPETLKTWLRNNSTDIHHQITGV
jgi:hypothetical protein